jgi:hypothetical protein
VRDQPRDPRATAATRPVDATPKMLARRSPSMEQDARPPVPVSRHRQFGYGNPVPAVHAPESLQRPPRRGERAAPWRRASPSRRRDMRQRRDTNRTLARSNAIGKFRECPRVLERPVCDKSHSHYASKHSASRMASLSDRAPSRRGQPHQSGDRPASFPFGRVLQWILAEYGPALFGSGRRRLTRSYADHAALAGSRTRARGEGHAGRTRR